MTASFECGVMRRVQTKSESRLSRLDSQVSVGTEIYGPLKNLLLVEKRQTW